MFKFLGLALVLVSWIAGIYLVKKWQGERSMPLSRHAARTDDASRLFTSVLIIGGFGFYIWLVRWFAPALGLSTVFIVLVTLAFAGQVITALVPAKDVWKRKIHKLASFGMGWLYFPISYCILSARRLSSAALIIGLVCAAYMVTAAVLFFTVKRARKHYLIFQALYFVAFQVIILSAAYLR